MKIRVFQKGFNFSQDGPGNRLVYHLQGCNMRCQWCANPEGIAMRGALMVEPARLADGLCPHGAISDLRLDRERCAACRTRECLHANRNQAIRLSCNEVEVEALVDEARRSSPLFFGGGGVTLSGGEPTLQFRAVKRLLQRLKEEAIHTAIETNATHARLPELLPLVDAPIMDCKHYDDAVLKRVTGVGTRTIDRNLAHAFASGRAVLVRIPLIGGINDAGADIDGFIAYFRRFPTGNARFEFLRFHEFGREKWASCGMDYACEGRPVEPATVQRFTAAFTASHLRVAHT